MRHEGYFEGSYFGISLGVLRASRRARVSLRTSSALAEGRGQRRVPCGVNCAPRLALRLTSFISVAGSTAARARLRRDVGVDGGEFDVKHLDEGLDGVLCCVAVGVGEFDLGALAVELSDAELFAEEADFAGGEQVEDGLGWSAVTVLQFGADVGERRPASSAPAMRLYMRRRWFSSGM